MNTTSAIPTDDPHAACRVALSELLELGMGLARRVQGVESVGEAVAAFERVSRAVRRTVRMVRWLDEAPAARSGGSDRVAVRKRILRGVEDRIDAAADPDEAGDLHAELLDRLDTAELEQDVGWRPPAEIIGEICRDLGLERSDQKYPSLRRGLAELAALQARAEAPPGGTRAVAAPVPALAMGVRPAMYDGIAVKDLTDEQLDAILDDPRRRCPR